MTFRGDAAFLGVFAAEGCQSSWPGASALIATWQSVSTTSASFIPMFIAGMREVQLVGACEKLEDPDAPAWGAVRLENLGAIGSTGARPVAGPV
ncbi:hypothetical protein [Kribbella speibonae]|uniref:hypothetical protein n=1 Tax=Kribbella speibonae TaxID=1572660 RepID=UPI00192E14FF|nr:hypothetical protein [Kribbella speibonae]